MGDRLRFILPVCGGTCLVAATIVAMLSLNYPPSAELRLLKLAGILAAGGLVMLLLRFLSYDLPERQARTRSPAYLRRLEEERKRSLSREAMRKDAQNGSALVIVLALIAALSALVLQIQMGSGGRLSLEQNHLIHESLRRAADDAVRAALHRVADDEDLAADSKLEPWAKREEATTPEGVTTITTVTDEDRYFNLNNVAAKAPEGVKGIEDTLMDVLYACGIFETGPRVRALTDWVDDNKDGNYESPRYARLSHPYSCPDRPVLAWDELFAVDGWKPALFGPRPRETLTTGFDAEPADCLTLLPAAGHRFATVNVNTASRGVLLGIIGFDQDAVVGAIINLREDRTIRSIDAVQQLMEPALFARISPYLSVRSLYFTIECRAIRDQTVETVRALARRDGAGRVEVLRWML